MRTQKNNNSITFITTLGVYLGFVFLCGFALPAHTQELNRKPLHDFATRLDKARLENVDLTLPFLVEMKGTLGNDGRFDPQTTRFSRATGDPKIIDIAKSGLDALNDSGFLIYVYQLSAKEITILLEQTDTNLSGRIDMELVSESRAKSQQAGIRLLTDVTRTDLRNRPALNRQDELFVLENTFVQSSGKNLSINFVLGKREAHEIIQRRLTEQNKVTRK